MTTQVKELTKDQQDMLLAIRDDLKYHERRVQELRELLMKQAQAFGMKGIRLAVFDPANDMEPKIPLGKINKEKT
jgi:hypothetical protein